MSGNKAKLTIGIILAVVAIGSIFMFVKKDAWLYKEKRAFFPPLDSARPPEAKPPDIRVGIDDVSHPTPPRPRTFQTEYRYKDTLLSYEVTKRNAGGDPEEYRVYISEHGNKTVLIEHVPGNAKGEILEFSKGSGSEVIDFRIMQGDQVRMPSVTSYYYIYIPKKEVTIVHAKNFEIAVTTPQGKEIKITRSIEDHCGPPGPGRKVGQLAALYKDILVDGVPQKVFHDPIYLKCGTGKLSDAIYPWFDRRFQFNRADKPQHDSEGSPLGGGSVTDIYFQIEFPNPDPDPNLEDYPQEFSFNINTKKVTEIKYDYGY